MLALLKKKISMTPFCWLLNHVHSRIEGKINSKTFEIKRMSSFQKIRTKKNTDTDLLTIHKKSQWNRIRWGDYEDITRRISKEDYSDTAYRLVAGLKDLDCDYLSNKTMKQTETGFKVEKY